MKKRFYHALFHIFSYLSDKTNGTPFIVNYKLTIGILIIGLMNSCNGDKDKSAGEKGIYPKPTNMTKITCYEAVDSNDSISTKESLSSVQPVKDKKEQIRKFEPPGISETDTIVVSVMCYMPSMDLLNRFDENIEMIKDSME